MVDLDLINDTIEDLEHGDTTFYNCQNLASLYIVREFMKNTIRSSLFTNVEEELKDILPRYKDYCIVKKKYQLKEISDDLVIEAMQLVCKELKDLIDTIYNNTDMEKERRLLRKVISEINQEYEKPL